MAALVVQHLQSRHHLGGIRVLGDRLGHLLDVDLGRSLELGGVDPRLQGLGDEADECQSTRGVG